MALEFKNEVLKLSVFKSDQRKILVTFLQTLVKGPKTIVLDSTLLATLQMLMDSQALKECGVEKVFGLGPDRLEVETRQVIFLIRPKVKNINLAAFHVRDLKERFTSKDTRKICYVALVPRITWMAEHVFKEQRVLNLINLHELDLDLLPIEEDVVCTECEFVYRDCYVEKDASSLYDIARAMMKFQCSFGMIPTIRAKGRSAKQIADLMDKMSKSHPHRERWASQPCEIHSLYIIDRDVDPYTPFMTQLTYEGLIDEMWGIKAGTLEPPFELLSHDGKRLRKMALNSNDTLFGDVRDRHMNAAFPQFHSKALQLQQSEAEKDNFKNARDMKIFMQKLPELQLEKALLSQHLKIAEHMRAKIPEFMDTIHCEQNILEQDDERVFEYLDDIITKGVPLTKVLRLLCLASVCGLLKSAKLDYYKRELVQTYGFETMLTLENLEACGLLKKEDKSRGVFANIRKQFRLLVRDIDEKNPTDIAYVHTVYAPLSIRIVETCWRQPWKAVEGILDLIPTPQVEYIQSVNGNSLSTSHSKVVMVFFVGGCTAAEISALRFLHDAELLKGADGASLQFVVGTTKMINGNTFIDQMVEKLQ